MTRRILVVDDDPDLRILLRFMLARGDEMEVVAEAADGDEAIEVAAACQPDVIVLDEMMPRMNGSAAVAPLREAAPGARIYMYSAAAHTAIADRFAAADGVVFKSDPIDDLIALIASA